MQSITIASIMFGCVFGSAALGMLLHARVPANHLSADSKDVVKLAMGLIATMAALVPGLLTASAKGTFDTQSEEVNTWPRTPSCSTVYWLSMGRRRGYSRSPCIRRSP